LKEATLCIYVYVYVYIYIYTSISNLYPIYLYIYLIYLYLCLCTYPLEHLHDVQVQVLGRVVHRRGIPILHKAHTDNTQTVTLTRIRDSLEDSIGPPMSIRYL
jgi:hypothetical protein